MKKLSFLIVVSFILLSCSHSLRITNLDEYFLPLSAAPTQGFRIGVTSINNNERQNSRYIAAIVSSLQRIGGIERVIYPYDNSVHQDGINAILNITVKPYYSGKGSNFLINWPGFLIFAPAIWGYGYIADIETSVNIKHLETGDTQEIVISATYHFRQAEIDRTWTEVGWLEVSLIPFIGGFIFTGYDFDLTDEFITKATPNYGPYIAQKIVTALFQKIQEIHLR